MSIVASQRLRRTARRVRFCIPPLEPTSDEAASLERCLSPDHLACVIARVLARLDLSPLWERYAGFGTPAYPPHHLLAAVLFETQRGHHHPAQWHRHAQESAPLRWLLRGLVPSRSCWYQFRDRVGPALLALVQQVVRQAIAEGFTPATRAALDGTLVAAHASRHRLLNEATLATRCRRLDEALADDARGVAPAAAPRWLAPTATGRRRQATRYAEADAAMQRRQGRNRAKRSSKRTAAERIVISPGDAEAALGRDKEKVFRPLYNVQLLDDLDSPLILAYLVAAQPNDAGLLGPVLRRARDGLGVAVATMVADASYAGGADLAEAEREGATVYAPWQANDFTSKKEANQGKANQGKANQGKAKAKYYPKEQFRWLPHERAYVCPQGQRLPYRGESQQRRSGTERIRLEVYRADAASCAACATRGQCTAGAGARTISRGEHEELIDALRERMQGAAAQELYKLRKQTVELANADLKGHRALRRMTGRGLRRAEAQVGLAVLAHNLTALDGLRRRAADRPTAATPASPPP